MQNIAEKAKNCHTVMLFNLEGVMTSEDNQCALLGLVTSICETSTCLKSVYIQSTGTAADQGGKLLRSLTRVTTLEHVDLVRAGRQWFADEQNFQLLLKVLGNQPNLLSLQLSNDCHPVEQ